MLCREGAPTHVRAWNCAQGPEIYEIPLPNSVYVEQSENERQPSLGNMVLSFGGPGLGLGLVNVPPSVLAVAMEVAEPLSDKIIATAC